MAQNAVVVDALRKAGFSEDMIPTMVGIAGAESGFNPQAHNPDASTGDNSYGLFQINMLGGMGPERRQQFGIKSNEELFDPYKNAQAAKSIYDQQGLGAWSVYRSGAYKDHVPGGALPSGPSLNSTNFTGPQAGQAQPGDINIFVNRPETEKKKSAAEQLADSFKNSILRDIFSRPKPFNPLNPDPMQ